MFNRLDEYSEEVKNLLHTVDGFVSYTLARTDEGGFSITVFKDQEGIDASVVVAKNWVEEHAADLGVTPPKVTLGNVVIQDNG